MLLEFFSVIIRLDSTPQSIAYYTLYTLEVGTIGE